ncbi:hypothetical protein TNCV_13731 [Trichonephila clavipes]|nr:hypothetical protein TNCV_13731 [Trichonephila clavipes]
MCVHHDAVNDAASRTWIHQKKLRLAIRAPRFVVVHTIEDVSVCDAASRITAVMISELRVHASGNVVELFMQTLVVLQTTKILDSGLVT